MKKILILGAGKSSPYLISYLLENSAKFDWFVTVGDKDIKLAKERVGEHPRGNAVYLDVNDSGLLSRQIKNSDLVLNILAPVFQHLVAWTCVEHGKHMISVSYTDSRINDLEKDAHRKGVILLTEIGLDPGIDHMSAASILNQVIQKGGIIKSFESYGGGLPAPDSKANPFNYVISWNPRNVVMAGENGAQYLRSGKIKIIPYYHLFRNSWPVEVEGIGVLEAYPNRDSLAYLNMPGLKNVSTLIRGTLRYPGWSETWLQIVRLGLPNEKMQIPNLKNKSYADLVEIFLPSTVPGSNLEERVANLLNISPTGKIMENLRWLGLFSDEKIGVAVESSAEVLINLISRKLHLPDDARDMVVLFHRIRARYPAEKNRQEEILSTMIHYGEKGGFTGMAKAVGFPAAIAAKLILTGKLPITGCYIPTHPAIYEPVLEELSRNGFDFHESVKQIS